MFQLRVWGGEDRKLRRTGCAIVQVTVQYVTLKRMTDLVNSKSETTSRHVASFHAIANALH